MKKIGLITLFKSYNYGVWLQAFATQRFLTARNYNVEMIDYSNPYELSKTKYFFKEGNGVIGYLRSFVKSFVFGKYRYFKKGFSEASKYYNISSRSYMNLEELNCSDYDVLIAGSDQIWNPDIFNGLDIAYLLQFGNAKKRLSISPSIGSKPVTEQNKEVFRKAFKSFDAISVREDFAKEQLQDCTEKDIKVLLDPTFLLSKKEWISIIDNENKFHQSERKYILMFFVSSYKQYSEKIRFFSQKYKLPIWCIQFSNVPNNVCDKKILGATLSDFVSLFVNAEMIVTDSFHGVAMSLNLGKNFIPFDNVNNPNRVRNLLSKVDLLDRINAPKEMLLEINYVHVNRRLDEMRDEARNWILNNV